MKFFRIDLLTLLISLFILSSCKNQDGIGLDPEQKLNGTLLVNDNIVVNTVLEDSVNTTMLPKAPLGFFKDPQIGTTESNIAMALSLPGGAAYTLPTGTITIDSALLVLSYADGFYGDSLNSKYKLNVYQLNERPVSTTNYYNTHKWDFDSSAVVGTKSFISRTHTGLKISDIVVGAKDTLKRVSPQLRVPLTSAFINKILFAAPAANLANNAVFQAQTKGLFLRLDKAAQVGSGGNFLFELANDSSHVDIYYRANNGTTIDTSVVTLSLATYASQIKHSYNATVAGVIGQTTSNSTIYLQGVAGLRTKVSFPGLKDIITQAGSDIILNRAELVITPVIGSGIPFPGQPKLTMYTLDKALQRIQLRDALDQVPTSSGVPYDALGQGIGGFGGYLSSKNDYHFIITAYIQDLMRGKTVDYGTYIAPVDTTNTTTVDYQATPQTGGRTIAVGTVTDKTSPNYPYRIKLNIIYTKIGK